MGILKKIKKNRYVTFLRRLIVYPASTFLIFVIRRLSWEKVTSLGRFLGSCAFHLVRYGRKRTLDNLTRVFGEKTEAEILKIAEKTYENLGSTVLEFLKLPALSDEKFFRKVDFEKEQVDFLRNIMGEKRGVIFASAHIGNWEMLADFGARLGLKMSVLYKPSTNPYLNRLWAELRSRNELIDINRDLSRVTARLRRNEAICLLFDENARSRGIKLEFFGLPASTYRGPAYFALRCGSPIVCLYFVRTESGRQRFIIDRTIRPERTGNLEADIVGVLREMNGSLERIIREYPDQWNWVYKRWSSGSLREPLASRKS